MMRKCRKMNKNSFIFKDFTLLLSGMTKGFFDAKINFVK